MRPNHHTQVVSLEERVQIVGSEVDYVVLLLRVSDVVVLEALLFLALVGVAPEQVDDLLVVFGVVASKFDLEGPLDVFDAINVLDGWTDTAMAAENSLLFISDDSGQWHHIESFIDFGENRVGVVDVFSESLGAFISEAEVFIYVPILVVTSKKNDLFGILELQSKEQADNFETVLTLVDVVS